MIARCRLAAIAALAALAACGDAQRQYPTPHGQSLFEVQPRGQWRLPAPLAEVSGLAVGPGGRLIAHNDERAVLIEIDIEAGRIGRSLALGSPPVRDDFEGVALDGANRVYLIASDGLLYRARFDEDGAVEDVETFETGLGAICEIEGLAYDAARESLIIACKTVIDGALSGFVALRLWSIENETLVEEAALNIRVSDLVGPLGLRTFSPSGIDIDPETGRLLVVAARENALVELDADGSVVSARRLSRLHVQPEGIAILADGSLALADEAGPRQGGRLTIYDRAGHD